MVGPNSQEPMKAARGVRTVAAASVLICLVATIDARAQGLPPSVAACAAEADVLKRLSCFDRAVAPFLTRSPATLPATLPAAAAPAVAQAVAQAPAPAADPPQVQARISSIDTYPDGIVVHLDNGQVWREDEDTPVDLGLRVGDSVTIERQVGAYWLSGLNGTAAKVRLKN